MAKQKASILDWTVNNTPKAKYQLKFRLENMPGVGTAEMVAGECVADSPVEAGKQLETVLQKRIGFKNFKHLSEVKIIDSENNDRAFLQIDTTNHVPMWGRWLNVF